MPFSALSISVGERIFDAQRSLAHLIESEARYGSSELDAITFNSLKGSYYVVLYACIEHCWSGILTTFLSGLNGVGKPMNSLGPGLASLALRADFQAAETRARLNKLKSYATLVTSLRGSAEATFAQGLMQQEVTATNGELVETCWHLLDLPGAAFSTRAQWGMVNEIFERRCAVAHGRETSSEVGAGVTVSDLQRRFTLVQTITSDWIVKADSHLASL